MITPELATDAQINALVDGHPLPLTRVLVQVDPCIVIGDFCEALIGAGFVFRTDPQTAQLYVTESDGKRAERERLATLAERFRAQLDASARYRSGPDAEAARQRMMADGADR